jgi:hypothetical protein
LNDFEKEKEIIEKYNPEVILAESLEEEVLDSKDKFKEILKKEKISNMTSMEEVKDLIKLCLEKNIPLIGIDFKNFGLDENLQRKVSKQEEPTAEEEEKLMKIVGERERRHIDLIKKYQEECKKKILVILGAWHLRDDSPLRDSFKDYKIIYPADKDGNMVLGPSNEEISWREEEK